MDTKELKSLENKLIDLVSDLKENLESDKDTKIDIFNSIRKVMVTLYYTDDYHNTQGFIFTK